MVNDELGKWTAIAAIAAMVGGVSACYKQPKPSSQQTHYLAGPIYQVTVYEGFTPSEWFTREGILDYSKGQELYESLNGEGHLPKVGKKVNLADFNLDNKVANIPVRSEDLANEEQIKADKKKQERLYNLTYR